MQEEPGGHTVLEAGDRVIVREYDPATDRARDRMARVKWAGPGGRRAALVVFPDEPEPAPAPAGPEPDGRIAALLAMCTEAEEMAAAATQVDLVVRTPYLTTAEVRALLGDLSGVPETQA